MRNIWNPWYVPLLDAEGAPGGGGGIGDATDIDVTNATGDKDDELEEELQSAVVDDGKGNKLVPVGALIKAKKEGKATAKKLKEVETIAARTQAVEANLAKAQPIIDAVVANPKLRAEALRIANGSRASADTTIQPDQDDDAREYAEDMGWYLADGQTPDAARGRRVMNRQAKLVAGVVDERVRPLAGAVVGSRAEQNIARAINEVDDHGVPLATRESIDEVVALMGGPNAPLLADPRVVDMVVNNAIGVDRRKGRTPKAVEDPVFLERQGGGRRRDDAIDSDLRRDMGRVGLSDKDMTSALNNLSKTAPGRGVRLE